MGVLDNVANSLPTLERAQLIQDCAAQVGFDWPDLQPVLEKIYEELHELKSDIDAGSDQAALVDEMGDVLFACVNLARHIGIYAEEALKSGNRKFERRFANMEKALESQSRRMVDCDLGELEALWVKAKESESRKGQVRLSAANGPD